jgi:hypothetical protein
MPAAPDLTPTGEFLWDEVGVAQPGDDTRGWPARMLIGAVARACGPLFDLVRDTDDGPGWSAVLSDERCPVWALPWLAQFAGVTLSPGLTEAQQRMRVCSPPSFDRGTFAGMIAAVRQTITGTGYVFALERQGSPYRITIVTRTSETPSPATTLAAAKSQKPAGLVLTHVVTTVRTYLENTTTAPTYGARTSTYANYAAARGF